jgi:hypothetical protein
MNSSSARGTDRHAVQDQADRFAAPEWFRADACFMQGSNYSAVSNIGNTWMSEERPDQAGSLADIGELGGHPLFQALALELCVPKIRFCNIDGEDRRERAVR